uniref:Ribosomal protein L19 n=1 Tax=Lotharella vacuolata TaxID=74820 RepID=A0A0H5BGW0_9EUKA|nr:ribosomal protein L19 [Lotharella vacuolata]
MYNKKIYYEKNYNNKKKKGVSSFKNKLRKYKQKNGRRRGIGKRKGTKKARKHPKKIWIRKIRLLRLFLKKTRYIDKIVNSFYREVYKKIKGNFFYSKKKLVEYLKIKKKKIRQNIVE